MQMQATVTDLGKYRAAVRPTVSKVCSWHEAIESVMHSNGLIADANIKALIRINFALQRAFLRTVMGV